MKRYSSLCAFDNEIVECSEKVNCNFAESVTDDSFYVPESELVKRLRSGISYGQALKGVYDFADGKDSGIAVPLDRYPGIDRAEVSEFLRSSEREFLENLKSSANKTSADDSVLDESPSEAPELDNSASEK